MPELPEVEAWRRALNDPVSAFPVEQAGPAHIATLKTFDPPLSTLEGRRFAGAERRAKRLLFPTEDGELVLLVHLMSAGRIRYLLSGEKSPKTAAFRLRFQGGGELVLTEGGPKKRAGVWLLTPEAAEAELEHLGPEALGLGEERLGEILASEPRRLHSLLRDQRIVSGIGRAWANEILHTAKLSPFAPAQGLSPGQVSQLAEAIDSELERGLELRERGAKDAQVYRVHKKLHEPCHVCGTAIERVDFEEHTIFYCPAVPDGRAAARRTGGCRGCCGEQAARGPPPTGRRQVTELLAAEPGARRLRSRGASDEPSGSRCCWRTTRAWRTPTARTASSVPRASSARRGRSPAARPRLRPEHARSQRAHPDERAPRRRGVREQGRADALRALRTAARSTAPTRASLRAERVSRDRLRAS